MKPLILLLLLLSTGATAQKLDSVTANKWVLYSPTPKWQIGQTNRINISMNGELVAYRKRDSPWVFLNPKAAVASLEDIAEGYGFRRYENKDTIPIAEIVNYPSPDTIRFEAIDPRPVRFTAQYCRNCAIVWRDGYLISGQPYVVRKGKLIKVGWWRWEVKNLK